MRFQQIKELLHYLEQVHHQLGLCYGRLTSQVDSETQPDVAGLSTRA